MTSTLFIVTWFSWFNFFSIYSLDEEDIDDNENSRQAKLTHKHRASVMKKKRAPTPVVESEEDEV